MKILWQVVAVSFLLLQSPAFAQKSHCTCTCVVKSETGKYTKKAGSGKDREMAGLALKKALASDKCEISPVCKGACDLD